MYSNPIDGELQIRVIKDFNFQEVAPDFWFSESGQSTTIFIDPAGQETVIRIQTMRFSNVRFNEHMPSSCFNIEPPTGTTVCTMN